jgi:hypothetical protein
LLLLLFGEQRENSLSFAVLGDALKKKMVALDVLATDETVHANLPGAGQGKVTPFGLGAKLSKVSNFEHSGSPGFSRFARLGERADDRRGGGDPRP